MAENPQEQRVRPRPLSPHLTIYRWPVTMVTSITHRLTGVALYGGTLLLAAWLLAAGAGFEAYQTFMDAAGTPLGQLVLFGFVWSLAYHLLNGFRHLSWDIGYGFAMPVANASGIIVFVLSFVFSIGLFALAYAGYGGYLQ
jgi:succinate dehydrogenase / fumarate reductase cytochrome b subunit